MRWTSVMTLQVRALQIFCSLHVSNIKVNLGALAINFSCTPESMDGKANTQSRKAGFIKLVATTLDVERNYLKEAPNTFILYDFCCDCVDRSINSVFQSVAIGLFLVHPFTTQALTLQGLI